MEELPNQTNLNKNPEPEYAIADVKEGKFHIRYFGGQTLLFIPKAKVDLVGRKTVLQLAEKVYGKDVLDEFCWMMGSGDKENSLQLELPPEKNKEENRVEQLIAAIENFK